MPPRKAQAVVAEEVAVTDKPATRSKTKKGADAATSGHVPFNVMSYIYEDLDEIEKKANLVSHGFGRNCARLSTGLVSLDMFLDGGLIPGGWYTVAGPEQSAKSTLTMTLVAACVKQNFNGVGAVFDYEGSSDEDYIMNMCKNLGIKNVDRAKIFGTQDPQTGQYIVNGMFRYYDPDVGEKFFQYMSMLRRRLPDKVVNEKGEAFYIFDHTVKNKKKLAGQYDAEYLRRQNKLRVPAENTSMQSLTVVDSYPAMLPDQMDDDDPSGAMALQARMFSDGIKKFRGGMRRKMMTILGVNQLRERPAQQHGDPNYEPCLIGSTRVLLADGSTESIKSIVDQKLDVEVMSFDKRTGEVSAKRIIDWKDNGPKLTSDLVTIMYRSFDHNGVASNAQFTATKNHKIWSDGKWVKAGDLVEGDVLHLSLPKDCYSDDQEQVIFGSLLGDGIFAAHDRSIGWNVTYNHVRYQVPYMMWKASMIDYGDAYEINLPGTNGRYRPMGQKSSFMTHRHFNPKIAKYARLLKSNHTVYGVKEERAALSVLDKLDLRGLAVWYMDDGYFANDRKNGMWTTTLTCDRFTDALKEKAIAVIEKLTGVRAVVHSGHGKLFLGTKDECLKFQEALAPYIQPSMAYKLYDCSTAGGYQWQLRDPERVNTMLKTKVLSVGPSALTSKYTNVYDLTVEDNHTYFVGGPERGAGQRKSNHRAECVAVSNCGNALKFYCVHPSTIVEYLDPHGNVAQMTAREYLDQYGPADMDERPPIRVPTAEGWAVPNEVFPTDGGKYAGKPTLVVKTATGETLYGSSGHSILTSTVTNVSHPWDDTPTWSDKSDDDLHDFGLRGMAAAPATVRRGRSFRDARITAPRVGWSRLTNLGRAALKNVFTFVESRDRDPRQTDAMWMQYLAASVPEYADIHRSLHDQAAVQSPDHANIVDVLAAFNMLNPEQVMESFKLSADEYDVVYAQYAYIEELVTLYLDLSPENVLAPVKIAAVQRAAPINQTDDYVDFSVGGSWVSSGIVSHNSDVRIRVMPRAIPDAFKNLPADRGVISEPSVEFDAGRVDRYKFISGRTIKNKLGGIPNQEFWARVWEADGKGNARGFDPVYDTYYYLKQLNLLGGQRNKIKFAAPTPLAGARRAITWQELKLLILGTTAEIKELCAELDVKPVSLRSWVFKFARSDEGRQRVRDSIVAKTSAAAEDDE